ASLTTLVFEGAKNQRVEAVFPRVAEAVEVAASPASAAPPPQGGGGRALAYAAFGVGAAGLVVGTVFGALALSTKASLDHECGGRSACSDPAAPGDIAALHTRSWIANAGFAAGALGVAGGLALLLLSPSSPPASPPASAGAPSVALRGWLWPGGAGLAGSFP
ncbi:MAG: hypothetical protein JOZ69_03220, partial [Myxococcales bacterium]|nr:hypothetical protein [Myxococcales bacterium]